MIPQPVQDYITARYNRWLDFAAFQCNQAGLTSQAHDLLNEVLYMLLTKDSGELLRLATNRQGIYSEMDFFVLKMIKTNALSPTSPYRYNNRSLPIAPNVDFRNLEIEDSTPSEPDRNEQILRHFSLVREVFSQLTLSPTEHDVFTLHFFHDLPMTEIAPNLTLRQRYRIYQRVIDRIREELCGKALY